MHNSLFRIPLLAAALALILAACDAPTPTPATEQPTAIQAPTEAPTATEIPSWTYVAFGDSWPFGAHCNGCRAFPALYADGLVASTGHPIDFVNLATNGGTSQDLLNSIITSEKIRGTDVREAVMSAHIVVISTGANDLEPAFDAYAAGTCGGADQLDCFRKVAEGWRVSFDGILTEIDALRDGNPTAIRLVTNSNEFLADPGLIDLFGPEFGLAGGAVITALNHDVLCEVAVKHGAQCVDLRPVLNGPNFDKPQDVNTQEAMQAVADALLASGLDELR